MKVLCPSCERLVELVDLRVERGGLITRCPACGAEQRQELPARPVTVPSAKAAAKKETEKKTPAKKGKKAPRPPKVDDEDENDEGPTIILLTPTSDAVPLPVTPPKKGKKAPPSPKVDAEGENDEGPTVILLTPTSDAVPLAIAPPGTAAPPSRPAEVAKFESAAKPPAIAPVAVAPIVVTPVAAAASPAPPPRRVVDAEFANLLNQLGDVPGAAPAAAQPQTLRPRNTGSTPILP